MINKTSRNESRAKRHERIRNKVVGTPDCPRLNVFRSNSNIYAQIIDDSIGHTICSASSLEIKNGGNADAAKEVGTLIAKKAKDVKIKKVVFDRGGYQYHGRVAELAEAARAAGLEF